MSGQLFRGKVAAVTGATSGIGRACAELLASQGASVIAGDTTKLSADKVIADAIKTYGGIHILIVADEIAPRGRLFEGETDGEWAKDTEEFLKTTYQLTHAAWQHFRKQGYGRVVNVSSIAALHGQPRETAVCTARHALIGYSFALAKEGAKKNIFVNVVLPWVKHSDAPQGAAIDLSADHCSRIIAFLVHDTNKTENGSLLEVGAGRVARLRWQRSRGLLLRADESLHPRSVLDKWSQVEDFSDAEYPSGPNKFLDLLKEGSKLPANKAETSEAFAGKVVLITGAGSGLGRAYALHFAKLGASVAINDIKDPSEVVNTIRSSGGKAVAVIGPAEDGDKNVSATIQAFGRIDVLVNNAGIILDKAFHNMNESMWDKVLSVHLRGTYMNSRAAWPHFTRQKYGRIVNTVSVTGIYGNFGQANYAAAKSAIIGLTKSLAQEGAANNIFVSAIAPNAGTAMTESILEKEVVLALKPDHIAPMVAALSSEAAPKSSSGGVYETGSGWLGKTRWERESVESALSQGQLDFELIARGLKNLSQKREYPASIEDHWKCFLGGAKTDISNSVLDNIKKAMSASSAPSEYIYNERDLILYALSVGANQDDLALVYEGYKDFQALPGFGLIPFFNAKNPYRMEDIMIDYDLRRLLHVDQFMEILAPIPRSGVLRTFPKLVQVVDKKKHAIVVQGFTTVDENEKPIFYNETTVMVRGSGGFGGDQTLLDRGPATAKNEPPTRSPDYVAEEKTSHAQAALYRLNGDLNPLHIDPEFSKKGGFEKPILHGLCTMSIAGRHVYQKYGAYRSLKARLTGTVIPGQTLRIEMWREGDKVIFQVVVKETGKQAIGAAGVVLRKPSQSSSL